ncbi:uncharacterized protein L969DRAFT_103072 [Mixia osmundae IAM 14324]|uniref:Dihydrofolate reductase n=1 Tax=Mixia osmundae (strain CBS 9802 / IAM 14324 / JCM 22182 / KY 12970) TaxID=764103 RepID=G7E6I1_MIXOS|nr:uncharacterized protein L969DRAFT_103072 [Mixia osmundae IAM 14324]KEI40402.1 hypothetical protein L969DRAFT_103072 [Mixia osmundae IAM 14324]GAA98441.1 hypothetical protein E5Q_05127 [Mixia osmundae IAM 14324]
MSPRPPVRLTLIVCCAPDGGIGAKGGLPWSLPGEMRYFSRVTQHVTPSSDNQPATANAVIMGRKSWESIPARFRPLKSRINVVLSRSDEPLPGINDAKWTFQATSILDAIKRLHSSDSTGPRCHRIFIIGGAQIYRDALALDQRSGAWADRILLTQIKEPSFECDTHLPDFRNAPGEAWQQATLAELARWVEVDMPEGDVEEKDVRYQYQMWQRS